MTSKDTAGPVLTLSEVSDILDFVLDSSAEKDQMLAHLRDGFPVEILGAAVITPAGHGLYVSYRKDVR